jgi:PAS domain S-box-containing protein
VVDIRVPVFPASVPAILVDSDGVQASIPLDSARETLGIVAAEIVRGAAGECTVDAGPAVCPRPALDCPREELPRETIGAAGARADCDIAHAQAPPIVDELGRFFAMSRDMLCVTDLAGHIQRLNPAWEDTLGFSAAEICSKPWVAFVHPEDRPRALEALARFRSGVEVLQLELRFLSQSGSYKWLLGSATPALDRGVVFVAMSDITDRKQLEEQLAQNQKLDERNRRIEAASRMKSEFLANMSHELRSPLNGIIGFSELLYDGKLGALAERPREFVGRIHASASHLLQLINGVLDLSRIEAGRLEFHPERLLVSDIIREVAGIVSALAAEKRICIETEIEAGVDDVTLDAGRLREVLYNYLSNALKFTGEKGRVVVRLKSEGPAQFRLEVSDTGIGILEKDIGRLFVEFQQLDATMAKRYQGTGLGLALTKHIVEAQGGRVGVASRIDEGSTFFAVLPRVPWKNLAHRHVARILVVDDRSPDRFQLAHMLESSGYLVETAATCTEAYDKCRTGPFDAISFDPDGAGAEWLRRIRALEKHRNTPVIVTCGRERTDLGMPSGVQGFLSKPVRLDRLLEALKHIGVPMSILEGAND